MEWGKRLEGHWALAGAVSALVLGLGIASLGVAQVGPPAHGPDQTPNAVGLILQGTPPTAQPPDTAVIPSAVATPVNPAAEYWGQVQQTVQALPVSTQTAIADSV